MSSFYNYSNFIFHFFLFGLWIKTFNISCSISKKSLSQKRVTRCICTFSAVIIHKLLSYIVCFSKISKKYCHVAKCRSWFFFKTLTLVCFSPYITHNYIASHVQFLKKVNEGRGRQYNVWRILPVGGKFNSQGDVLALLVWYLMLVYAAVAIPVSGLYGSRKITLIHPYAAQ